jgi:uncharacterized membrane protein
MRLKNLDLIVVILIVVINLGWIQIPNRPLAIGIILAMPLVLILPGYVLTQTLFHKHSHVPEPPGNLILRPSLKIGQPINAADHIILSLGLSMAIDVGVGFALNFLPIGLQGLSWILSLGLITTILALLVAFLRRKDAVKVVGIPGPSISIYKYVLFGSAILVATIAIWLSIIRPPDPQPSFTQFWIFPAKNNSCGVLIGIHSFESAPVTYRIVVTSNGTKLTTWSSIVLAPQQEWDQSIPVKSEAANVIYIEARLYRADKPEVVYREVHMIFNNSARNKDQKVLC